MERQQKIKRVVIAGGGTAGWMAGVTLAKFFGITLDITLIESDDIGTIAVGEATIPALQKFHRVLEIDEQEFMVAVKATFKLGIDFTNWGDEESSYFHSFRGTGKNHWSAGFQHFWLKGQDKGIAGDFDDYNLEFKTAIEKKFDHLPEKGLNYAYHMDATLYAGYLRKIAENHGLNRLEGKIVDVGVHPETGYIEKLTLKSGQVIEGDLFLDCTGFIGLLIEKTLHTGYENWEHWLPCDSAVAMQTRSVAPPIPYTRSIARESGWQWRIPLQHRVGNGLVFCSRYMKDNAAIDFLKANVEGEPVTDPRVLKFTTGTRLKHWNKNCIALGLASGFMEPLESTSLYLIQRSILLLMRLFPLTSVVQSDIDEFNEQTKYETENIRDFIILHYKLTNGRNSSFWRDRSNMDIPDSLQHRLDLFRETGRAFRKANTLFGEASWARVMLGQGLVPEQYHPIVNTMSDNELKDFLQTIKSNVNETCAQLPSHHAYIQNYCKAME